MADTVTYPEVGGVTRGQLRRDVGTALGDLVVITATDDAADETTFTDTTTLTDEPRYYTGRQVYFTYGTPENQGLTRRVQSSSQATGTLTFTSALVSPVQTGDQAHMVNFRGVGWTISDYHTTFDAMIRDMIESHWETTAMFTVSENYDSATNIITLPSTFVSVEALEFYDANDGWVEAYPFEGGPMGGWSVDRFQNAIQLSPSFIARLNGATMRVKGMADPDLPVDDGDVIALPHEWMLLEAQARLLELSLARHPGVGERNRLLQQYRQRADNLRPLGFARPGPYSARIR